jgi:hypothetical protein
MLQLITTAAVKQPQQESNSSAPPLYPKTTLMMKNYSPLVHDGKRENNQMVLTTLKTPASMETEALSLGDAAHDTEWQAHASSAGHGVASCIIAPADAYCSSNLACYNSSLCKVLQPPPSKCEGSFGHQMLKFMTTAQHAKVIGSSALVALGPLHCYYLPLHCYCSC